MVLAQAMSSVSSRTPPKYAVDDILEHSNGDHEETVRVAGDPTWTEEPGLPSAWVYPVRDILTQRMFDAREWQLQHVDYNNFMQIRRNGKTYYTNAQVDSDWSSSDSEYSSDSDDSDDEEEEGESAAGGRKYMPEDRAPPSKRQRRELWNLRF